MYTYQIIIRRNGSCHCTFKEKTWENRTLQAAIRAMKKEAKSRNIAFTERHIEITDHEYRTVHTKPDWFSIGLLLGGLMTDKNIKKDDIVSRLIPIETRYGFPNKEFMDMLNSKFSGPYSRAASKEVVLLAALNRIRSVYKRMDG